jgi:hypothetical protein
MHMTYTTTIRSAVRATLAVALLAGAQMASAQVAAGSVIKLGTSLPGSQGPFAGSVVSGAGAGGSFLSFCLEKYETFTPNSNLYVKSVSGATTNAAGGHYGNSTSDPLSSATAWLFTQFSTNTLTGYSANSSAKADSLQNAIWYLEDEISLSTVNADAQAKAWVALAKAATTGAHPSWTGLGNVHVLNLFKNASYTQHAQDQLYYYVTSPVPEAETAAMLLAGLGVMGVIVRRRKAKAAL